LSVNMKWWGAWSYRSAGHVRAPAHSADRWQAAATVKGCATRTPGERERERERDLLGNNVHDGGVQGAAR